MFTEKSGIIVPSTRANVTFQYVRCVSRPTNSMSGIRGIHIQKLFFIVSCCSFSSWDSIRFHWTMEAITMIGSWLFLLWPLCYCWNCGNKAQKTKTHCQFPRSGSSSNKRMCMCLVLAIILYHLPSSLLPLFQFLFQWIKTTYLLFRRCSDMPRLPATPILCSELVASVSIEEWTSLSCFLNVWFPDAIWER